MFGVVLVNSSSSHGSGSSSRLVGGMKYKKSILSDIGGNLVLGLGRTKDLQF